jgi:hypothetical protein
MPAISLVSIAAGLVVAAGFGLLPVMVAMKY